MAERVGHHLPDGAVDGIRQVGEPVVDPHAVPAGFDEAGTA